MDKSSFDSFKHLILSELAANCAMGYSFLSLAHIASESLLSPLFWEIAALMHFLFAIDAGQNWTVEFLQFGSTNCAICCVFPGRFSIFRFGGALTFPFALRHAFVLPTHSYNLW